MAHNLFIIFAALAWSYTAFLAGDALACAFKIGFRSRAQRAVYPTLLGYGCFGMLGLGLALIGGFGAFYLHLVTLMTWALSRKKIAAHIDCVRSSFGSLAKIMSAIAALYRGHTFFKILLTAWLALNFLIVFVPVTGYDSIRYHLPIIMDMIERGRLTFSPLIHDYYPWVPLFGEIMYAAPLVVFANFSEPFIFQVLQYGAMLGILLLIWDAAAPRIAYLPFRIALPMFILSVFDFAREVMHAGYVDVPFVLFGLASVIPIIQAFSDEEKAPSRWLALSAVMTGLALGIKYTGLYFLLINGLFLAGIFFVRRISASRAAALLASYAGSVFAISGFWYAKNAWIFGNPIYPLIFLNGQRVIPDTIVYERSIANMLFFPLIHFGSVSANDTSSKLVVFGYFALVYLLVFLFLILRRSAFRLSHVLMLAFVHLYLYLIFFTAHYSRYFLAPLIMLPAVLVLLLDEAYRALLSEFASENPAACGGDEGGEMMLGVGGADSLPKNPSPLPRRLRRGRGSSELSGYSRRVFVKAAPVLISAALVALFIGNVRYFHVKFLYAFGFLSTQEYVKKIGSQ